MKRPKEVDVEKLSNAVTRGFNQGLLLGDITELVMDDIDDKKDEKIKATEGGEGESPKPDADAESPDSNNGRDDEKKRKWFCPLVQIHGCMILSRRSCA
eukprot:35335-Amphidinium_carterae.1